MKTKSPDWLEVLAAIGTGILFLVFHFLGAHGLFIVIALFGWGLFLFHRIRKDNRIIGEWGLGRNNLGKAFFISSLFALPLIAFMALYAAFRNDLFFPLHGFFLLLLYPVWGIIQQFLVLALLVRNIGYSSLGSKNYILVLIGAVLFCIVHVPDLPLMAGTFFLGMIYVPLYLRYHNIWPLGIYHGWLGTFFYFWVLGRDPLVEILNL